MACSLLFTRSRSVPVGGIHETSCHATSRSSTRTTTTDPVVVPSYAHDAAVQDPSSDGVRAQGVPEGTGGSRETASHVHPGPAVRSTQ